VKSLGSLHYNGLVAGLLVFLGACSPAQSPQVQSPQAQSPQVQTTTAPVTGDVAATPVEAKVASTPTPPAKAPTAALVADPGCLTTIAWISEPEASDIELTGCRSAALLPDVDESGWRNFDDTEGGSIATRNESIDPQTGSFSVDVIYRSGGTFSGKYRITGKPNAQNILKVGEYKVKSLD
jgi:hypothetical protein